MTIPRIAALAALLSVIFLVGLSHAAPSCCDPNSNTGVSANSFQPRPPAVKYAPLGPAPSANTVPGIRQASVASGAVKPAAPQQLGCCGQAGPRPQTYTAPTPSCCPGANRPVQPPAGACGCRGEGGIVSAASPGYQTSRPIGQFMGASPKTAQATSAANQGYYMQAAPQYQGQGFYRPGYFGQGSPFSNTLY
jgi:hypothetical protein